MDDDDDDDEDEDDKVDDCITLSNSLPLSPGSPPSALPPLSAWQATKPPEKLSSSLLTTTHGGLPLMISSSSFLRRWKTVESSLATFSLLPISFRSAYIPYLNFWDFSLVFFFWVMRANKTYIKRFSFQEPLVIAKGFELNSIDQLRNKIAEFFITISNARQYANEH